MRIIVIHSGRSSSVLRPTFTSREWEGYHENAAAIRDALQALGHVAEVTSDGLRLTHRLARFQPDLAWICSGGIQGRDQACHLPSALESLGIPYVGSTPLAAGIADNKTLAKKLVAGAGIRTPAAFIVHDNTPPGDPGCPFPLVVKPNQGLCSCGVRRVDDPSSFVAAVADVRRKYRSPVLVESYIEGEDLSVPVVQREHLEALPALRRQFRWNTNPGGSGWRRTHPESAMLEGPARLARLSPAVERHVSSTAVSVCHALNIRHFARIDFRFDGSNLYFLEANHKPDLTPDSLFALSASTVGVDYLALIRSIVSAAADDAPAWTDRNRAASHTAPESSRGSRRAA